MAPLDRKWFRGSGDIPAALAEMLEITSLGSPVTNTLTALGWDGTTAIASVGLELSPDNKHVLRAQLVLRGHLAAEPITLSAATIWGGASKEVTLQIDVPEGGCFHFNSGGLASNFLACEETKFVFLKLEQVVPQTDWAEAGVCEFAIRCVAHLCNNSNNEGPLLKYHVQLVPLSVAELHKQEPASASSAWPGFMLAEGTCRFFPGADQTNWHDPICPLLCRGSHRSKAPYLPTDDEIRFSIAALMRTAKLPVHCKTANEWRKQYATATADIASLECDPTITWPVTTWHAEPLGSLTKTCYIFTYLSLSDLIRDPIRIRIRNTADNNFLTRLEGEGDW